MPPKYVPKHYTVYADQSLGSPDATRSTWLIRAAIVVVMLAIGLAFRHPVGDFVTRILS